MLKYIIKQGDCISSLAYERGLFWEQIWDHPENAKLKQERKNPNVLYPGDELYIPELTEKEESCTCEQTHRFRLKGVPARIRIRFMKTEEEVQEYTTPPEEDTTSLHATIEEYRPEITVTSKPRANVSYIIEIDGETRKAKTDSDGILDFFIPPNAKKGKVTFQEGDEVFSYPLKLGCLDPISKISGVKERLHNLGYSCEEGSEEETLQLQNTISTFQKDHNITVTGKLDQVTIDKLKEIHGC